jgi:aspartate kinase
LLRAAKEALTPGSREHLQIVKDLLDDHLKAAREIIRDTIILEPLERQIEYDCIKLKSFLEAAQVSSSSTMSLSLLAFAS